MGSASGEVIYQPAVYSPEKELACFGFFPGSADVIEDPFDLGGAEIRIDQQACGFLDMGSESFVSRQFFAVIRSAAALPDYRVIDRLARIPVPDYSGLALVGYPDDRNVLCIERCFFQAALHSIQLRGEYFLGVMFDPGRLREFLREFLLRYCDGVQILVIDY